MSGRASQHQGISDDPAQPRRGTTLRGPPGLGLDPAGLAEDRQPIGIALKPLEQGECRRRGDGRNSANGRALISKEGW